jgi:tRNA pseudouridine38-40 synthase
MMRNLKLLIEYDGTNYHGWQIQPNGITVQEVLQKNLAIMTQQRVRLIGSGRTDAGVHALGQVANFHTTASIPPEGFLRGLNSMLPRDIVIRSVEETALDFNAQLTAKKKTYLYRILNREVPSAIHRNYSWHYPLSLDKHMMQEAAELLVGENDFASFQATHADTGNSVREVFHADWFDDKPPFLCLAIEANGFLKQMVRIIVGTLVEVGRGKISGEEFKRILEAKDRRQAKMTAPPQGLFLLRVDY